MRSRIEPVPARILRTGDLVLANVLVVVGTPMFGLAALLGGAASTALLLALLLFHLPLALVVSRLAAAMPLTGGSYEWVSHAFGEFAGFLMAWTTWAFFMVFSASAALGLVTALSFLCPGLIDVDNPWVLAAGVVLFFALLAGLSLRGLGEVRWLQAVGSVSLLLLTVLLAWRLWSVSIDATSERLTPVWPKADVQSLAIFLKLAVFGWAGLECMAILAGEVQEPARRLPRAILWSVPVITLIYLIGTAAVQALAGTGTIDLVNPVAQVLGTDGSAVALLVLSLLLLRDLGQSVVLFVAATRLPMVAGWHRMLPAWVARTNRYGVARGAVLVTCAAGVLLGLWAVLEAGRQEAFQWLLSAAGILFGLTYLVIFALPLFAAVRLGLKPEPLLKPAASLGLLMVLAFVLMSVFPVVEVTDPLKFGGRVLAVVGLVLLPGVVLARQGLRRRSAGD